jgi:hypothetical protein
MNATARQAKRDPDRFRFPGQDKFSPENVENMEIFFAIPFFCGILPQIICRRKNG